MASCTKFASSCSERRRGWLPTPLSPPLASRLDPWPRSSARGRADVPARSLDDASHELRHRSPELAQVRRLGDVGVEADGEGLFPLAPAREGRQRDRGEVTAGGAVL